MVEPKLFSIRVACQPVVRATNMTGLAENAGQEIRSGLSGNLAWLIGKPRSRLPCLCS